MDTRKIAWVTVVTVALGLSNWSIAYVARRWGVPWVLSYTVSAVFDGAALLMADLALKAARLGDSTFAPSACLFLFGGASAYFNGWHAQLAGLPLAASVLFAFPPVSALAVTELQLRHDRRQALRDRGRIADPVPAFGGTTWLLKPIVSYRAVRAILKHRLAVKLRSATGQPATRTGAVVDDGPTDRQLRAHARRSKGTRPFDGEAINAAAEKIAADLDAGRKVSKRHSAREYDISEYHAELIIKDLRAKRNGAGQLAGAR